MKGLGTIATFILLIAAAGAIATMLQLLIIAMLLYGVLFRTRETLTLIGSVALLGVTDRYPWAAAVTVVLAIVANFLGVHTSRRSRAKKKPLLLAYQDGLDTRS